MTFAWTDLGAAPAPDQFEVSVFGPGFGECIVVHIGSGNWVVVDSCIDASDADSKLPAAERYLRALGVEPETAVKFILATHWHDDHVRGIARLVEVCRAAQFSCSSALVRTEFLAYARQLATGAVATEGAKVREINRVMDLLRQPDRQPIRRACGSKRLITFNGSELAHGQTVHLTSLSPSDREFEVFLEHVATLVPIAGQPKRAAPPRQSPNLASVVLAITLGDITVSLAADMELHVDRTRGWNAVVAEATNSGIGRASLVKAAHHGSNNGHHNHFWSEHVVEEPLIVVTPFNRLPDQSKLPTERDIKRLAELGRVFIAGPPTSRRSRPRDPAVARSLRESDIEMRDLRSALGLVRLRRTVAPSMAWQTEVFTPAYEVQGGS